ncbi:hypothetical protein PCANC_14311 [Puccinia coronata f. sp. avenae]|uniref:Uncharacterized protein n=2 Tax=Puccinia coronata f. sp. avenae TaxID=200324 RepID=A0A2N5VLD4_9BASI|nr:hypothetical protein PCANC_14311 [Puccinia coronata f. sp. avenae]
MVDVQISKAASKKAKALSNCVENKSSAQQSNPPVVGVKGSNATTGDVPIIGNTDGASANEAEFLECLKASPSVSKGRVPQGKRARIQAMAEEACKAGNSVFAEALFHGLSDLVTPTAPSAKPTTAFPPIATEGKDQFKVDGELTYTIGEVTNHNNIGFTPYLDENIRKLHGPLPLTFLNKKWQQKVIAQHLKKQTRESALISETTISYKGPLLFQNGT